LDGTFVHNYIRIGVELETVERIVPVIHPALPYKADNSPGVKKLV